jgi:anaerobic selenocysteine-containing dehydrogenase
MSEEKKTESITEKKISRRSMLKWTGALAAAVAIGVGAGYGTDQLLRPITSTTSTVTQTEIRPVVYDEQVYTSMTGDTGPSAIVRVYVKNGRIVRIRPITYTEEEAKPWQIEARGKVFTPPKKSTIDPHRLATRRRIYNPTRVKYPLKRAGFTPGGKGPIENRGRGEFVRISWDEATDIIAKELNRVKETYGPSAVLLMDDGHGQPGNIHLVHGLPRGLLGLMGGYTYSIRNPDSWEGWCWGATHVWGEDWNYGYNDQYDLLEDTMQNCELLINVGDVETTQYAFAAQDVSMRIVWLKELGVKKISITPDLNQEAGLHSAKWIPVLPGTDAAWAAAVAYVWINEGTYYKDYVYTHGYGFDKWKDYVLGVEDGVPKTPEWAEPITGIKARIIRALAREWASKKTSVCGMYSAGCRVPYAHEWNRMLVYLMTMQGVGRPGVHYLVRYGGLPNDPALKSVPSPPGYSPAPMQIIYKDVIPDAILNPPVSWYGSSSKPYTEDQYGVPVGVPVFPGFPVSAGFPKHTYPAPGMSEIHMMWLGTVSHVNCWNCGNKFVQAFLSSKIEFIVAQHPWLENDALFADIVLPGKSVQEREDIMQTSGGNSARAFHNVAVYSEKCIDPIGESKSDYETLCAIAQKLGVLEKFTQGKTVEDWIRWCFDRSSLPANISYEDFKAKGYYYFKFPDTWPRYIGGPGIRWFYEKPQGEGLKTMSGKVEFYSQGLAKYFPDDKERPPVAHYIPYGETNQESLSHPRAKTYPLLLDSSHPRYRWHSQLANISWLMEIPAHWGAKMKVGDYYFECLGMHTSDAQARGIKYGDIVRVYNERGAVLCAAFVTERLMPGVVSASEGANYDPVEVGVLDKGGCVNTIFPSPGILSKNATGMMCNAILVEVEKLVGPVPLSIAEKRAGKG